MCSTTRRKATTILPKDEMVTLLVFDEYANKAFQHGVQAGTLTPSPPHTPLHPFTPSLPHTPLHPLTLLSSAHTHTFSTSQADEAFKPSPLFSQLKRCKRKEEFEWHSDKNHVQRMLELPEVTFLALAIY